MKPSVSPYATATWCIRIVCTNGTTARITAYPRSLTMSNGQVYETDSGYDQTAYSAGVSFAPAALDIEGIAEIAGISRDQIVSGVFDNARVYIFKCDFLNPVEDYEEITLGFFGKTTLQDERYRVEGMGLVDALNQSVGSTLTPACNNTFGDTGCGITLSLVEVSGTVTHVSSSTVIRDSARTEVADWFAAGTIRFTSGNNTGLKPAEIKAYALDGTITTFEPLYYTPQVGDAYILTPGCRRRLEDCRDKWGNVAVTGGVHALKQYPNKGGFSGFPQMPTESIYQQVGGNR